MPRTPIPAETPPETRQEPVAPESTRADCRQQLANLVGRLLARRWLQQLSGSHLSADVENGSTDVDS
jgi:hypothetical protein